MGCRSAGFGLIGLLGVAASASAEVTCFTHFQIAELPGTEWGTAGPAVGDFDGDGDPDLVSKVWNTGGRPDLWRNDNPGCGEPRTGRTR